MINGLPLPRIAAQTGVVLQTLRSFSARVKKVYTGDKHSNHRGARPKQTAKSAAVLIDVSIKTAGKLVSRVSVWQPVITSLTIFPSPRWS